MPLPGTKTVPTPGFLTTTLRLCAGTKVLTEIYESSPARAIWRFFLLTILCSILASIISAFVQKDAFIRAGQGLDEEIGAFVVTPESISFRKDPDTPRRLKLPYIMLEYFPGDTFTSKDFNVGRTSDLGVVILPGGLASWSSVPWNGEDIFSVNLLSAHALYAWLTAGKDAQGNNLENLQDINAHWEMFSGPGFAETLKKEFGSPSSKLEAAKVDAAEENTPPVLATGSQAAHCALFALTIVITLSTFIRNFMEIALLILLVALIQFLRSSTLPRGLDFKNVLTIMVYSTFPAQIAATLFDAAGGARIISFQILFVIIFFFYQLFAFRAVMKKVCPMPERRDDDFDDSDF